MDGVVIDSEPLYEKVEKLLFKQYGISIPHKDQKDLKGTTEAEFYDRVEKRYKPNWNRAEVVTESRRLLVKLFVSDLEFMPGFTALADRLTGHYLLGLVTSTTKRFFRQISRVLPIKDIFDEIICADDILNGKPHPEPYLTMMERLQVIPEEVVVVEDSVHGIESARRSGAICVALASSFSRNELEEADTVINSLDEINDDFIRHLGLRQQ